MPAEKLTRQSGCTSTPLNFCAIITLLLSLLTFANTLYANDKNPPANTALPISIEADSAEQDEKRGLTIYKGNVTMTQGALNIRAARVEITSTFANENKPRQISQIVANGEPATFTHEGDEAHDQVIASANTIEYFPMHGAITMSGNASLAQQGSSLKGDQIEYLIAEKRVKAAANPGKKARVKTILTPGQSLGLPGPIDRTPHEGRQEEPK